MGLSSITRMYTYLGSEPSPYAAQNEDVLHRSLSRSETCFWVGDLYEAWALYQFGKLTLEVIQSNIVHQARFGDPKAVTYEDIQNSKAAARGLHGTHSAVESLVWLGILSFLLVCVAEAGWSLWLLTFETSMTAKAFDENMSQFTIAGFLASGAAIYNVFVVEESYHLYLESYYPRLKFITVKILVTFAFVQKGIFRGLVSMGAWMPQNVKTWVDKIPLLGQIINLPSAQFELFYASLIITECFVVCVAHYWAWNADEEWYDTREAMQDEESNDLMPLEADKKTYGAVRDP